MNTIERNQGPGGEKRRDVSREKQQQKENKGETPFPTEKKRGNRGCIDSRFSGKEKSDSRVHTKSRKGGVERSRKAWEKRRKTRGQSSLRKEFRARQTAPLKSKKEEKSPTIILSTPIAKKEGGEERS